MTDPRGGSVKETNRSGSPSTSESFARTLILTDRPMGAITLSCAATGGSFTGWTVTTKVCGLLTSTPPSDVPPLSLTRTEMVAVPFALAADVNVKVPSGATAGPSEKRPGLLLLTTSNVTV